MYDYDENLVSSGRYTRSNRAFVEAAINEYENKSQPQAKPRREDPFASERMMVMENTGRREAITSRYHSFVETVNTSLVTEALYKIFKDSVDEAVREDNTSKNIMRAMVSQYVHENGYHNILNRMKTASVTTSCIYKAITETASKILESTDKGNPDTFFVKPEMKDEFFKQLDYSDSSAISDAINQRVSDAMQDFITANTRDHEDITTALKQAQDKISEIPEDDAELREAYEIKGKRAATEIRNRPKGLVHCMVTAMCESVMKHSEMHDEFMFEGRLDIEKIVSRTSLMYTFMEMLNTSRIDIIDEAYIDSVIKNLSE